MRLILALLLFCCMSVPVHAQPDTLYGYGYLPAIARTVTDSPDSTAWQKITDRSEYASYKNKVEFHDIEKEEQNRNRRLNIVEALLRFFASAAGKALIISVLVFLFLFLVRRWLRQQGGSLFYQDRKIRETTENPGSPEDLIQDWPTAMQQAAQQQDYRLAIRFGYLWLLQWLHERQLIDYHPNKTNREYAAVLPAHIRAVFLKLSRNYERTWYGNVPAAPVDYSMFVQAFETLKNGTVA